MGAQPPRPARRASPPDPRLRRAYPEPRCPRHPPLPWSAYPSRFASKACPPGFACQSSSASRPSHLGFACQSRSTPEPPHPEFACQSRSTPEPPHPEFACQSRSPPEPPHPEFACQSCSGPGLPTSGLPAKVAPAHGLSTLVSPARRPFGTRGPTSARPPRAASARSPPRLASRTVVPSPCSSTRVVSGPRLGRHSQSHFAPAPLDDARPRTPSWARTRSRRFPGRLLRFRARSHFPPGHSSRSLQSRCLPSLITSSPTHAAAELGPGLSAGAASPGLTHLTPLHPRRPPRLARATSALPALAFRLADLMLRPGFASNQKILCRARFQGSAVGFAGPPSQRSPHRALLPSIAHRRRLCSGPPAAPHRVVAAACDSAGLASINRRTDRGNPEDAR
ncbi:hypothetical protein APR08_003656 [Nocardia amikacinitolerans]|nr:hypothetical protein [Nocardia amikacinitolerans]